MNERSSDTGTAIEGVTKSPASETLEASSDGRLEEGVAELRRLPLRAQVKDEYLDLLTTTVTGMISEGAVTTAAAVSLRMRQALPGFTPQAAGYGSFKGLLQAAEATGRVALAPIGTVGNGDIVVTLPNDASKALADETNRQWVAQPVWHAVFSGEPAFMDRGQGNLVASSLVPSSTDLVELPTVSRSQFAGWVKEFASTQHEPAKSTLAASGPVEVKDELRKFAPAVRRAWFRFLRTRVAEMLDQWAGQNDIDPRFVFAPPATPTRPAGMSSTRPQLGEDQVVRQARIASPGASVEDLRRTVIRAVSEMSRSDLLRLPIPLEYLLR
jgi:hypothetical protein